MFTSHDNMSNLTMQRKPICETHEGFTTSYMVSGLHVPKSSAKHLAPRRFSQKGFDISIFGHHRCPFSGNFSSLVQIRIE